MSSWEPTCKTQGYSANTMNTYSRMVAVISLLFCLSCDKEKKLVHVEDNDHNGNPEHYYSYYLDEAGKMVKHGKEMKWWAPGIMELEQTWVDGHRNGPSTLWYRNGNTQLEQFFRSDSADSIVIRYFENGNVQRKSHLKNLKAHGEDLEYDEKGRLYNLTTYQEGVMNGPHKMWYENGDPMWDRNFLNGELQGTAKWWWRHPHNIGSIMNYDKGHEDGIQMKWHNNGKLSEKYLAQGGQRTGTDSAWDEKGRLVRGGLPL